MEQYNRRATLLKITKFVLLTASATAAVIAGYLLYRGSFDGTSFSNWLFYAAIAYLGLAVVPLYDVLTSSNSASYTYGEYAVKGRIDNQSRIDDMFSKKNYRFSILMTATSILLFLGAFIAERLL